MNSQNDLVTKKDLQEFGDKLEQKLEQKLEEKLTAKFKVEFEIGFAKINQVLDDKIQKSHDKIFNLVDGLAREITDGREHRAITSHQITENTRKIGKLEKKVFGSVSV